MTLTSVNRRAMAELIARHKHGLEATIRMTTTLYDINVVFEGTQAYTKGRTIVLPNIDIFALSPEITDAAVEEARAYFIALKGYAWRETAVIVESDAELSKRFAAQHGSLANVIRGLLDEIRSEHRFGKRGAGIAEAIEYTREQWVWPRMVRRKVIGGPIDFVSEALHGLQVRMKHDTYADHSLWKALSPEARSFVERNANDLDCAHDTLKMDATASAERLGEIVVRMLVRWKEEWKAVAPALPNFARIVASRIGDKTDLPCPGCDRFQCVCGADDMRIGDELPADALDAAKGEGELKTSDGLSPFLLVTYGRATMINQLAFADGFVHRVEVVPQSPEGWEALQPLTKGEIRTLVLLPPDPEVERALNEALANLVRQMMAMSREVAAAAEEELESAKHEIEQLPADEQPYLVYTTKNDRFVVTPEASLSQFGALEDASLRHVGAIKRRLQTLLRVRTRVKWRGNQEYGEMLDPVAMAGIATSQMIPQAKLRPYRTKLESDTLLETEVGILTDVSGSMRGTKLRLAREASLCFAEALDLAKMSFAVWAFTSNDDVWSTEAAELEKACRVRGLSNDVEIERTINMYGRFGGLHIETVKRFDEHWLHVRQRLPAMGGFNNANYDADSVHWAVNQLLARRAKRRVLFVLSDGLPDTQEPPIQVARQRRHLSDVVRQAISRGVEVVGIGICNTSVTLYYPRHVVIHRVDDLPRVVMEQMDFLLLRSRL